MMRKRRWAVLGKIKQNSGTALQLPCEMPCVGTGPRPMQRLVAEGGSGTQHSSYPPRWDDEGAVSRRTRQLARPKGRSLDSRDDEKKNRRERLKEMAAHELAVSQQRGHPLDPATTGEGWAGECNYWPSCTARCRASELHHKHKRQGSPQSPHWHTRARKGDRREGLPRQAGRLLHPAAVS